MNVLQNKTGNEMLPASTSDPEGIRTPNPQNRNLIFYPLNYEAIVLQK